jgi:hypothetical protein
MVDNQNHSVKAPLNSNIEEKTHEKLILFEESMFKFPTLMRQFYSTLPKCHEDGGLSVSEQGRVIHYGIKLEAKALELIDQYVAFIKQIGKNTDFSNPNPRYYSA